MAKKTIKEIQSMIERLDCTLISTEYLGYKSKIEFICNKHKENGVQSTYLKNITRGLACHYCGKEKASHSREVPDKELKAITEKAGFIFIRSTYENNKKKIVYKCPHHLDKGEQISLVGNMRRSHGKCNYCLGRNRTHEEFIKIMYEISPSIEILSEYEKSTTKIKCRCKIDGYEWTAIANNLLSGQKCRQCAINKMIQSRSHTNEWFIQSMKEIHPNIVVLNEYISMKHPIQCKCTLDGYEWSTTPDSLINRKTGCPKCAIKRNGDRCRKSNETFIKELQQVNPNIIPLEEYKTDHEKITCLCTVHNYAWEVAPNKLLHRGTGCPKCACYSNEEKIASILEDWGFRCSMQKKFDDCADKKPLPFDIYLDDFNILIEYDGEGHFHPIKWGNISDEKAKKKLELTQKHDYMKDKYCAENNIPLIRIPYWENDNLEGYLFDELTRLKILIQ